MLIRRSKSNLISVSSSPFFRSNMNEERKADYGDCARAVKGYIRKSHVLFAMKDFSKALGAIELVRFLFHSLCPPSLVLTPVPHYQAAEKDTAQAHTSEISSQMRKITFADNESRAGETDEQAYARAMRDPEVQEIMRDPVFQSILQQAQQDPKSLQSHMQDPMIRRKVDKLVRAVRFPTLFIIPLTPVDRLLLRCTGYHQDRSSINCFLLSCDHVLLYTSYSATAISVPLPLCPSTSSASFTLSPVVVCPISKSIEKFQFISSR